MQAVVIGQVYGEHATPWCSAPAIPEEHGGLGLGPHRGGVLTLWKMTKRPLADQFWVKSYDASFFKP